MLFKEMTERSIVTCWNINLLWYDIRDGNFLLFTSINMYSSPLCVCQYAMICYVCMLCYILINTL